MNLSVGIVGLPNVGKSTLFNALTKNSVPAENYPFCTIDPSVGIVPVPDTRLASLAALSNSQEVIPAVVEFVDIAGLVKGASEGEGLGNQFLANIREVNMIAEVVRIFEDPDVIHVAGAVDPLSDIEVINLELMMADLQSVTKRLSAIERDAKRGDADAVKERDMLERMRQHLEAGHLIHTCETTDLEAPLRSSLNLLTDKPVLYVLNKKAGALNLNEQNDPRYLALLEFLESTNSPYVTVDAGVEHDLKDLSEDEKQEFRREYGAQSSGIEALIRAAYDLLGLISFFTTGEKETRAWTIKRGATAPVAGAAIHSDFRDKFIRASVTGYEDLINAGSLATARERGTLRTEGKEYIVKDGDVMEFRI